MHGFGSGGECATASHMCLASCKLNKCARGFQILKCASHQTGRPTLRLSAPDTDGADEEERQERGLARRLQLRPL